MSHISRKLVTKQQKAKLNEKRKAHKHFKADDQASDLDSCWGGGVVLHKDHLR